MRAQTMAAFLSVLSGPVLAQGWQEYSYPDLGFSVSFPAEPNVVDLPAKTSDGVAVTQKIFSASWNGGNFRIAVTDYSGSSIADNAAISQAADKLRSKGEVLVDIPARVNRNYGQQLSIAGKDGNRTVAAIFFVDHKLYDLEGVVRLQGGASADAIRFQQSLNFLGGYGGFGGFRRNRFGPDTPPGD